MYQIILDLRPLCPFEYHPLCEFEYVDHYSQYMFRAIDWCNLLMWSSSRLEIINNKKLKLQTTI
jgi:hypothetical protein